MRSIRVYLLILVLGAVLPPAVITGVVVWRAFASNRAVAERRLLDSARVDAAALDRTFGFAVDTLRGLASSPSLEQDDLGAFHAEALRMQMAQSGWYTVMLLSADNRQLVSSRLPWGTPLLPVTEPASLIETVRTARPVIGRIRQSPRGPELLFPIRVPVMRNGAVKYVVSAVVNVDSLTRVVPGLQADSDEWTRTVLDPEGTVAVRTRGREDYVGAPASDSFRARLHGAPDSVSSETTREGVPVYAASSRGMYGWTAVIVVPRSVLDAPLTASLAGLLIGGVLLMVGGLAVVTIVSRRLSTEVDEASAAAAALSEGKSPVTSAMHLAETDRLMRSIVMASSLLDKRARERDEEIGRAEAARVDAERANRTKDQFLAVLGHELRNPLAPALTALELMKARSPETFKREREVLERQVAHMVRLVNDLLDVSRLARGKVQLERRRFELREAADRAIDMAQPLLVQGRHSLDVSVPARGIVLDADLDRIVQVLSNLLTNAARYIPSGGHVVLSATSSVLESHAVITCEDDGPGIPPELLPKLFDPFEQGPRALDRHEGGLGLGLTLARTFTELHGGAIRVENRSGGGCRITVTLPLAGTVDDADRDETTVPAGDVMGRHVLVVDDNLDAAEMLQLALEEAGHLVVAAGNGTDAIDKTRAFQPEIAIVDIGLPGMDGYELARYLRAECPGIRLVALTGYGQAGDVAEAAAAGFDAHCAKPISIAALLDVIAAGSRL